MTLPMPYEVDEKLGTVLVHRFLRHKAIVINNPDVKLYVSAAFLQFVKRKLNVAKCKTLSGKAVEGQFRVDSVHIYVDENCFVPFYIYY